MIKHFLFFLIFLPLSLFSTTITIINDSNYQLEARIYDQNNEFVGSATLSYRGSNYSWSDSYHAASDWTEGPFTVEFYCPNGDKYGKITHVANKSTIRATGAIGSRYCKKSY